MNVLLGRVAGFGKSQAHILYTFIYATIFVLLPTYLCGFIKRKGTGQSSLCSPDAIMLPVVKVWTEIGIRSIWFSAPVAWNLP